MIHRPPTQNEGSTHTNMHAHVYLGPFHRNFVFLFFLSSAKIFTWAKKQKNAHTHTKKKRTKN